VHILPPGASIAASVSAPCSLLSSHTVSASPSPATTYCIRDKPPQSMYIADFVSQVLKIGNARHTSTRQGELHGSLQAACWTRTHAGRCWGSSALVALVLARRSLHFPSSGLCYKYLPVWLTNRAAAVAAGVTTKRWTCLFPSSASSTTKAACDFGNLRVQHWQVKQRRNAFTSMYCTCKPHLGTHTNPLAYAHMYAKMFLG
jgi:hypothetical protein